MNTTPVSTRERPIAVGPEHAKDIAKGVYHPARDDQTILDEEIALGGIESCICRLYNQMFNAIGQFEVSSHGEGKFG